MRSLQKIFFLFFLTLFCLPSYAAVTSVELASCSVFSEADNNQAETDEKEKEDEEEPDCE